MAKRFVELLKDLLIVILSVAIVVLTLMALPAKTLTDSPVLTAVLRPVAHYFGISQVEFTVLPNGAGISAASQPLAISVRNAGGRNTCQYSFSALDPAYETMGSALAQALAGAKRPEPSDRETLYAALENPSVAFCYADSLPCDVLADWLGVSTEAKDCTAKFYALCLEDRGVALYLVSDAVLRCQTEFSSDSLRELCGNAPADGSFFAFESTDESYSHLDGLSLLPAAAPTLAKVTAQTLSDARFLTALASDLGFNPYAASGYRDSDGTEHYTEANASLSISADGTLELENSDPSRLGDYPSDPASRIFAAASLLNSMLGENETEARLYLCSYRPTDGGAVCTFCYVIDGVPILQKEPVRVEFTGSYISAVYAVLRTYGTNADTLSVLPPLHAAAISERGTDLRICYADSGLSSLTAGWAR